MGAIRSKFVFVVPNINWGRDDVGRINPWVIWPVSVLGLAAVIKDLVDVVIIDANIDDLSEEEFKAAFIACHDGVIGVGISVYCDEFSRSGHKTTKLIKDIDSAVSVVMGGGYVTLNFDLAVSDANVDYLVVGEGEYALLDLLKKMLVGEQVDAIDGVVTVRNYDGSSHVNIAVVEDLDELPHPAYDDIAFEKYCNHEERVSAYMPPAYPYGRVVTSRGCPYSCAFCQVKSICGPGIRYKSVDVVLGEVESMIDNYDIKGLLIDDANFTADLNRAKSILAGFIERGFELKWKAMNLSVVNLDEELIDLIKKSGCDSIDLAIESGSERVLSKLMHKPVKLSRMPQLIRYAQSIGLKISANFIIGSPGETWAEIMQTIKYAEMIDVDYVKLMVCMPLRHTKVYEEAVKGGMLRSDFDFMDLRWGIGEISTNEFTSIELMMLRVYEWDRINFSTSDKIARVANLMGVSRDKIEEIRVSTRKHLLKSLAHDFDWSTLI